VELEHGERLLRRPADELAFMATYGPELLAAKGTADHWTPAEQIMVAQARTRLRARLLALAEHRALVRAAVRGDL
jgi:hypothetical protein